MNHENDPVPLSQAEWNEVAALSRVREDWGLEDDDTGAHLSAIAYGAKFRFVSGSPGYVGDLFIIAGDALSAPPMMLTRNADGGLREVDV